MIGIVSLAPVLAAILIPIVAPFYTAIGADPSSFANTILAIDMGGYALAGEMAKDPQAGLFSWVFLGTMIGPGNRLYDSRRSWHHRKRGSSVFCERHINRAVHSADRLLNRRIMRRL